ncbi:MAG: hypothetical protein C4523_08655 [Myxococcales bacterium]|nr:MAG: hypothetical protein C4523_08655 [Myxococcales bacterium]
MITLYMVVVLQFRCSTDRRTVTGYFFIRFRFIVLFFVYLLRFILVFVYVGIGLLLLTVATQQ